ncbi:MAG: hypothetical protein ACOCY0_02330 [Roseicyclus sp.]
MIGLLFAASVAIEAPRGGLSAAPLGIAEHAAAGMLWPDALGGPASQVALAR